MNLRNLPDFNEQIDELKKMKLLVLSDSHGHDEQLLNIIIEHADTDAIIFLGDGERDFDIVVNSGFVTDDRITWQSTAGRRKTH